MSNHYNNVCVKYFNNKKVCSNCNLQTIYISPIYKYWVVECGCELCDSVAYFCEECIEIHKIQKCTFFFCEKKKVVGCVKMLSVNFFREKEKWR